MEFLSESSIVKSAGDELTHFDLVNNTGKLLELFWIDREGKSNKWSELAVGERLPQETAIGHVWHVKTSDSSVSFKFVADKVYGKISVSSSGPTFAAYEDKTFITPNGEWSTHSGYGLIDAAKALGVEPEATRLQEGMNNHAALNLVNAPSAWKAGYTGKGVTVAVLDSGISQGIAELEGRIIGGYDAANMDNDPSPAFNSGINHSIAVAAYIAGKHDYKSGEDVSGIAPDVNLLNVRVGHDDGGGSDQSLSLGIRWAVDNGAKVLAIAQQSPQLGLGKELEAAVQYAFDHDVVTVFCGGNYGIYGASGPALLAQKGIAIAVGNYDVGTGSMFASSNLAGDNPGAWVNAASTGFTPTFDGGYEFHLDGGTSYATPYVAGLAALLFQQDPKASAAEVISKILVNANGADAPEAPSDDLGFVSSVAAEFFKGGKGLDTVVYDGERSSFVIEKWAQGVMVTDKVTGAMDTLQSVERVQFDNLSVALDVGLNEKAGSLVRLYKTSFGRSPDGEGLGFWMKAIDNGLALTEIASSFIESPEFASLYGADVDDGLFITNLYVNVLGRFPENEGFQWHLSNLKTGAVSREQTVINFSESEENFLQLIGTLQGGVEYLPFA